MKKKQTTTVFQLEISYYKLPANFQKKSKCNITKNIPFHLIHIGGSFWRAVFH